MGKWFKRKGLQGLGFRAWLMFRESQLLILLFNNNNNKNWAEHLTTIVKTTKISLNRKSPHKVAHLKKDTF